MCLATVQYRWPRNHHNVEEAYKVFRKTKMGNYNFEIFQRAKSFKIGQTLIDRKYKIIGNSYITGFHSWRTLTAARQWKDSERSAIVKVRLWDVRVVGIQNRYVCYVAKRMQLIEEVN